MANEMPFWRRLYTGWMVIAGRFGHVQTLVVLALFYVFLIGPIGLGLSAGRRDLLHKRGLRQGETAWNDAESAPPDLERAKLLS